MGKTQPRNSTPGSTTRAAIIAADSKPEAKALEAKPLTAAPAKKPIDDLKERLAAFEDQLKAQREEIDGLQTINGWQAAEILALKEELRAKTQYPEDTERRVTELETSLAEQVAALRDEMKQTAREVERRLTPYIVNNRSRVQEIAEKQKLADNRHQVLQEETRTHQEQLSKELHSKFQQIHLKLRTQAEINKRVEQTAKALAYQIDEERTTRGNLLGELKQDISTLVSPQLELNLELYRSLMLQFQMQLNAEVAAMHAKSSNIQKTLEELQTAPAASPDLELDPQIEFSPRTLEVVTQLIEETELEAQTTPAEHDTVIVEAEQHLDEATSPEATGEWGQKIVSERQAAQESSSKGWASWLVGGR